MLAIFILGMIVFAGANAQEDVEFAPEVVSRAPPTDACNDSIGLDQCKAFGHFCNEPEYMSIAENQCAYTCRRCEPVKA